MQVTPPLLTTTCSLCPWIWPSSGCSSEWPWQDSWSWRLPAAAAGRPWGGSWTRTVWTETRRVNLVTNTNLHNKYNEDAALTSTRQLLVWFDERHLPLEDSDVTNTGVGNPKCSKSHIGPKNTENKTVSSRKKLRALYKAYLQATRAIRHTQVLQWLPTE